MLKTSSPAAPALTISTKTWGLLLLLWFCWGGSFYYGHIALTAVPPLTLVFARVFIGFLFLVPVLWLSGLRIPRGSEVWRGMVLMAILNSALPFSLIAFGLTRVSSGLGGILNATVPMWTAVLAHFATSDEKLTRAKLAGILASLIGVIVLIESKDQMVAAVIVGHAAPAPDALLDRLAKLAFVGATACYAISAIYGKRFRSLGVEPIVAASSQLLIASVLLLPLMLLYDRPWELPPPSMGAMASLLAIGVIATGLAYILYYRILGMAGATVVSLVTYLVPVSATLLGVFLLGESFTVFTLVGIGLIALGLVILDGRVAAKIKNKLQ
ncbi:MAG: DMT family transporter [Alphaproteobacteria bacterium]|nr:DMT family transporter [Alphaproteobacteria bacterium]